MGICNLDDVIDLYFNKHLKRKDISSKLNISLSYVTKIVRVDSRYKQEKENRTIEAKKKHQITNKVYMKNQREQKKINEEYYILEEQHRQASLELSKAKHLTNENYRRWNSSAYSYNNPRKRFEFKEHLGRSSDIPKYIKAKI